MYIYCQKNFKHGTNLEDYSNRFCIDNCIRNIFSSHEMKNNFHGKLETSGKLRKIYYGGKLAI